MPLAYPEQLGNLLPARTDFAKLFRPLLQYEQSLLSADPRFWVDLVVEAGSRGKAALYRGRIDPNQNVIRSGTERTGVVDLTVGRRLRAIPANADLLATIEGSRSMGAMGNKVEDVGPDAAREKAGIFEFRASRGVPLPLAEWFDFALGAQRYITPLHGG